MAGMGCARPWVFPSANLHANSRVVAYVCRTHAAKWKIGDQGYPKYSQQRPQHSLQLPVGHQLLTWVKERAGSQRRRKRRGRGPAVEKNGLRGKMHMLNLISGHKIIELNAIFVEVKGIDNECWMPHNMLGEPRGAFRTMFLRHIFNSHLLFVTF